MVSLHAMFTWLNTTATISHVLKFDTATIQGQHSKITLIIRCATDAVKKSHYYEFAKLTTAYGITVYS